MYRDRVIGSKIQRIQVTFFSPMNLIVLSDPGPHYVLADRVKRARAFFVSLSSQTKTYLYIFLHSEIASDCHLRIISGPCYRPAVPSITGERTWPKQQPEWLNRMGTHMAVLCVCFICTNVAGGSQRQLILRYADTRRPARERNPQILRKMCTSIWKCRHTSVTQRTRSGSNGHTVAWALALLKARGDTEGPQQQ